jgi:hypothetical protein
VVLSTAAARAARALTNAASPILRNNSLRSRRTPRIVDILVDQTGQVRAAIIDFGGFLGVGSRKIAVAWNALHFPANAKKGEHIALELTRDQVRAAPEFKEDKPVVVLGAAGSLESLPFP